MQKIRWGLLAIYAAFAVMLRVLKLFVLSHLPIRKRLYILSWFAGLGNNIIQLAHAQYISERAGFDVRVPPHKVLRVEERFAKHEILTEPVRRSLAFPMTNSAIALDLMKRPEGIDHAGHDIFRSFFFSFDLLPFFPRFADYRRILKNLLPIVPHHDDPLVNDDTLVIHIRSGDVFSDDISIIPNGYVQPPLSYYLEIIETFKFDDIVVVTEKDLKNPCIAGLKRSYPGIRIQASDLLTDMSTIISARNLVVNLSSFSLCLGLASNNIRRMFIPRFESTKAFYYVRGPFSNNLYKYFYHTDFSKPDMEELDLEVQMVKISCYTRVGDWRNTKQQNELMLQHSRKHLSYV